MRAVDYIKLGLTAAGCYATEEVVRTMTSTVKPKFDNCLKGKIIFTAGSTVLVGGASYLAARTINDAVDKVDTLVSTAKVLKEINDEIDRVTAEMEKDPNTFDDLNEAISIISEVYDNHKTNNETINNTIENAKQMTVDEFRRSIENHGYKI